MEPERPTAEDLRNAYDIFYNPGGVARKYIYQTHMYLMSAPRGATTNKPLVGKHCDYVVIDELIEDFSSVAAKVAVLLKNARAA